MIEPKHYYLLKSHKLNELAPWAYDWGIDDNCIVYVSEVFDDKAVCYWHEQLSGAVPITCLYELNWGFLDEDRVG